MRRLPEGAPILAADRMRAAEGAVFDRGVSQDALMERAGAAIAQEVLRLAAGRATLVLAGPGNNGGDGYVVARLLEAAGLNVAVATYGAPRDGAAARMAERWRGATTDLERAPARPVLVDGLLGIGTPRRFEPATAAAIERLVAAAELTLAIDLPSGIDADTGQGGGVLADVTVALGALKPGHVLGAGVTVSGHVLLADIGLQATSRWRTLATPVLAAPRHDATKFSRGMIVVVCGAMPGAAWLAAGAALHGGAGYVVLAGLDPPGGAPHAVIRRMLTEPGELADVLADDRIGGVVIGPGLGRDTVARSLLDTALASDRDLVIDGDALSLLGRDVAARIGADRRRVCLTPHAGEFARMFDAGGSKIAATLAAAAASGATIVHKGPDTVIAAPDGTAAIGATASPWLATAGSGDVLAGVVAARLASGGTAADAAAAAVWLHTRAAALAGAAFSADDLIRYLPAAITQCSLN